MSPGGDLILLIRSQIFCPTNVSRVIDVGTITLGVWTLNTFAAKRVSDLAGKKVVVLRGGSSELRQKMAGCRRGGR